MNLLRAWWADLTDAGGPGPAGYAVLIVVILIFALTMLLLFGEQSSQILSTISPPV